MGRVAVLSPVWQRMYDSISAPLAYSKYHKYLLFIVGIHKGPASFEVKIWSIKQLFELRDSWLQYLQIAKFVTVKNRNWDTKIKITIAMT